MERLIRLTINKNCLNCKICCRFSEENSNLKPSGLTLKKHNDLFVCSGFNIEKNNCKIYSKRPTDCQLYPYVIAKSEDEENILLAIDNTCPNTEEIISKLSTLNLSQIKFPAEDAIKWEDSFVPIKILQNTNHKSQTLNKLTINDRLFFNQFLPEDSFLSAYTFAYHFIWEDTTSYFWKMIDNSFCLFAKNGNEIFMPIAPLNLHNNIEEVFKKCFDIMNFYNENKPRTRYWCGGKEISRIENVSEDTITSLSPNEFKIFKKDDEYIYKTENLSTLKGDKYKTFRWLCNVFEKENKYSYEEYNETHLAGCVGLLNIWLNEKFKKTKTDYEKFLLQHANTSHKKIFTNYKKLGLIGRVVVDKTKETVIAYTFGCSINKDVFCILTEVSNQKIKGASPFIFKEFCNELKDFKYINTMGDEGIGSLRFNKLKYKPEFKKVNYTIMDKNSVSVTRDILSTTQ
ncbi:MAG: phosphatidylglycerol lysyltransferase domain-containing protein [Candidatus Firestonebacteria bacterium]